MIGNITFLFEDKNYGQRLQTYALQQFCLSEFGERVFTVDFRKNINFNDGRCFHAFERDHLNLIPYSKTNNYSCFSKVIMGGDQVLRWKWVPQEVWRYPKKRNLFTYSASVGDELVSGAMRGFLRERCYGYSVREDTNLHAVRLIDPVFLLYDKWRNIVNVDENSRVVKLEYYVRDRKLGNLLMADGKVLTGNGLSSVLDPLEFVSLCFQANSVETNSFHGLCFGLLANVPTIRISRAKWNDPRITSLMSWLGIVLEDGIVKTPPNLFSKIKALVSDARYYLDRCLHAQPATYAAYHRDVSIRAKSSSGGICPAFAQAFYADGGVVYGATFSDDFKKVISVPSESMSEYMSALVKSKYCFCLPPDIDTMVEFLKAGRRVLFIGSPCQVAFVTKRIEALNSTITDNLVCVAFRCGGFRTPGKLVEDVERIEARYKARVCGIDCRPNHETSTAIISLTNGQSVSVDERSWWSADRIDMCQECRYGHGMMPCADIVVGDWWDNSKNKLHVGTEFTPERGCTIVDIFSQKGHDLWDKAKVSLNRVQYP